VTSGRALFGGKSQRRSGSPRENVRAIKRLSDRTTARRPVDGAALDREARTYFPKSATIATMDRHRDEDDQERPEPTHGALLRCRALPDMPSRGRHRGRRTRCPNGPVGAEIAGMLGAPQHSLDHLTAAARVGDLDGRVLRGAAARRRLMSGHSTCNGRRQTRSRCHVDLRSSTPCGSLLHPTRTFLTPAWSASLGPASVRQGDRYALRRRLVRFVVLGFIIALSIARCCRWIALTAALVHQPATVFAQVSMRLRGVPRMVGR
jgi:hypothetical protein